MRTAVFAACVVVLFGATYSAYAIGIPAGTRLEIVADATYVNNQAQLEASAPAVVELIVLQVANVTVERGMPSGQVQPGTTVYLPVRIRNIGNGDDSFALSAATAKGWSASLIYDDNCDGAHQTTEQTPVTNTGMMVADGYSPCFAKVAVPANANQNDTVTVRAVSSADAARGTAQAQIPLDVPGSLNVSITDPTVSPVYAASGESITIQGMATGSAQVTSVTWKNDRGGTGTCTGGWMWSARNIGIYSGTNVLTVTAKDAAGRTATDTLTVTAATVTAPSITIASPTEAPSHSTSSKTISLAGTSSDAKGILSVAWTNDRGGSGVCTGTDTWGASGISLSQGHNTITVTARNTTGNQASDAILINYSPDTYAPGVIITAPTADPTYSTQDGRIDLAGSASSDSAISTITWSNDRGGSGVCSGTVSWSVSGISLRAGQNVITISGEDSQDRVFSDTLTVAYAAPQTASLTITIPTTAETYTTGRSSVNLAGVAPENVGVTQVRWSNSTGGSGTCTGTTSWSAPNTALAPGENVVTVVAYAGSAIISSDVIRVTRQVDTAPPVIEVESPTDRPSFARNCAWVRLSGSVTDDTSVASVSWENGTTGESGACVLDGGTWTAAGIALAQGENLITVTAQDGMGDTTVRGLTVSYVDAGPGEAWVGRAMVSLPIIPDESDPKPVVGFEGAGWSCFQTQMNSYAVYPSSTTWLDPVESTPGRGFWGYFSGYPVSPYGTIPPQDQPVAIHLYPGWNLVGHPFITELAWDVNRIMVREPGKAAKPLGMSLYVTPGCAWGWRQDPADPRSGSYYIVFDSRLAPGVDDKLLPWMAYWIQADRECDLILPAPEGMQ